jgi:release factor glutamine methyltransferase
MNQAELFANFLNELQAKLDVLPDKAEETATSTLNALWHLAAGEQFSVERADTTALPILDEAAIQTLADLITQRLSGVPLGHLTQRQQFMDLEFIVGPEALVPRKETELLVKTALVLLDNIIQAHGTATVLDVCTGAGNIALSLAHYQPAARIFAADLSGDAVQLANRNKAHLQPHSRVQFFVGNLLDPFANDDFFGKVDVLTCNPPYISSGKLTAMPEEIARHEPQLAFDGGPFGLSILGKLLGEAPQYLKPNGWLVFEVGLGQGEPLHKRLAKNNDYQQIITHTDKDGNVRVLALQV